MSLYNAELSAGSLMIAESRRVAALLLLKPDEAAWSHAIKVENILQKNSPATAKRQARLIRNRLETLDDEGLRLVAEDTPEVCAQILLVAAVRHSRLLGDYLLDVYRSRLRRLETQLNAADWDAFLHECAHRDPIVESWSDTTRAKLLQVLLRILAETRYLESTRSLRLTPPLLHPRVLCYLATHNDIYTREAMEQIR
ncbi:DUF1819 family protein [Chromobacterium subtsugae]|uniref:DUF1819 family protein n=1 Tax=Chromobacterium subtsugae TaxID=251747 RepID=UPI000640D7E5|nr:DUF1819 family protein [Chromobacterium subtsugae]